MATGADAAGTGSDEIERIRAYARSLALPEPVVRRRRLNTSTGAISVLQWGRDAPRLVLVHGAGATAQTWNGVLVRLGVAAIAVDLPGHGESDHLPIEGYRIASMGDMVASALVEAGLGASRIVGHSLGGFVAARSAERLGGMEEIVVVDATPHRVGTRGRDRIHAGTLEELVDAMSSLMPHRNRDRLAASIVRNTRALTDGRREWPWDPKFAEAVQFRATEREGIWASLERAGNRVTLLRAALGGVTPEHAEEFARRVPGSRVVTVEGAGHNVQSDAPEWLAAWLRERL